jgi:NADPH2:quinone reductase
LPLRCESNAPKTVALIYGIAGGLGQLMTPLAKHLGAFVIGVVANGDGVAKARALGYDATIVWGKNDLPKRVAEIANGKKVSVV